MSSTAGEVFTAFFNELDRRGIPCAILHGYENLPGSPGHDIDYAVAGASLPAIPGLLAEVACRHGWRLVQTLQHGLTAFYSVAMNLENPAETLELDACSDYARIRRLLVPEGVLLGGRRRFGAFWIPAPAAEFIYEATKLFDAKRKEPAAYLPRLRTLWEQDRAGAEAGQVVEPQPMQLHTAGAGQVTRCCGHTALDADQGAVQGHRLRRVFDRVRCEQAAACAQWMLRVAVVVGAAGDALRVPTVERLQQAHRAAVRDQLGDLRLPEGLRRCHASACRLIRCTLTFKVSVGR